MKTYGKISYSPAAKAYGLALTPNVSGKVKRFFPWAKVRGGVLVIPDTAAADVLTEQAEVSRGAALARQILDSSANRKPASVTAP